MLLWKFQENKRVIMEHLRATLFSSESGDEPHTPCSDALHLTSGLTLLHIGIQLHSFCHSRPLAVGRPDTGSHGTVYPYALIYRAGAGADGVSRRGGRCWCWGHRSEDADL